LALGLHDDALFTRVTMRRLELLGTCTAEPATTDG